MGTFIADAGPTGTVIYATSEAGEPAEHERLPAAETDDLDGMLAAYGWTRVGPWARSDDMPAGHRLTAVRRMSV